MSKVYIVKVEEDDNGELVLPFPEEMIQDLGWEIGDTVCWRPEGDGWVLVKEDKNDAS